MGKTEENAKLSRFISLILRHNPAAIGIKIERVGGWADVNQLIDGTKIRANQGHSIDVVIEMEHRQPPEFLYHGTAGRFIDSIMARGLLPGKRNYVHLSPDYETAVAVGYRHSKPEPPVILKIYAGQMAADGYDFMISDNGVWQIAHVLPQYFTIME